MGTPLSSRQELLALAAELARRGEPFALATVVARTPPSSAQPGDMAIVKRDGGFQGWVGGACTRSSVVSESLKAIADGEPRLLLFDPDPDAAARPGAAIVPMTCHSGGKVEIHVQPVVPPPRLLIFGSTPVARALSRLGKALGYAVWACDPSADEAAFPDADERATSPEGLRRDRGESALFAVVATQGEWDETAIEAAVAHAPDYLGVVASARRFGEIRTRLAETIGETALGKIKNPAGLDLGAKRAEEIALGILSQIVMERNQNAAHPAPRPTPASAEARDPVCGMSVRTTNAAHHAEYAEREFFFCCAGCRQRFLENPGRYLPARPAP